MKDKSRTLRKVLSLVLSFAIILPATISLGGESGKAQAKTSLPYIEDLKTASSTFNILEIVPAAGQGSIGYYIKGQEPCANWMYDAAAISGQSARQTSVRNQFAMLQTLKILGATTTDTSTPLAYTGQYTEAYPWAPHDGYTKMTLDSSDTVSVAGTFTPAVNGPYTQSKDFALQSGGTYVQVIDYFKSGTTVTGQYYYVPQFAQVVGTVPDNTAVYTNTATINDPSASPTVDGYVYFGTTGTGFEGMEIGTAYYYVTSYSAPSATKTAGAYVGVSNAYTYLGTGGYFKETNLIYTYVGTGGTYDFATGTAGPGSPYTIKCNTVYYTGGYTNNNWFLKNVFDWDTGDVTPNIKFKVTTVVGSSATAAQVNAANLIVLSYGFNPNISTGAPTAYSSTTDIDKNNDLTSASSVTAAIKTAAAGSVPVIVDYRLYTNPAEHLQALVRSLYTTYKVGTYTNSVNKSVFFFAPDTTRTALVTNQFSTLYTASDYTVSTGAFYAAYEVAVYENFIRDEEGSTAGHLETDVNMARAIRYIINYKGQRVESGKSSINVLYLAPTTPSTTQVNTLKTSIYGWTAIPTANITVAPMSTLEFVGKSDDLIENYDMIYVGDVGGTAISKLDSGYAYENIGSPVTIRPDAVGLTDAEYSSGTTFTGTGGKTYNPLKNPQTTRYSGNDLSTKKLAALNDYAVAGHPVIIADGLTSGSVSQASDAVTFGVTLTNSSGTLTATVTAASGTLPTSALTYKWYNGTTLVSSVTSSSTTQTYTPTASGSYYCTVTYTVNDTAYTATSNTMTCTLGNASTTMTNNAGTAQTTTMNVPYSYNVDSGAGVSQNLAYFYANLNSSNSIPSNTSYKFVLNKVYYSGSTPTSSVVYQTTSTGTSVNLNNIDVSLLAANDWCYYYWTLEMLNGSGTSISNVIAVGNRYVVTWQNKNFVTMATQSTGFTSGSFIYSFTFSSTVTPTSGTANNWQTLSISDTRSGWPNGLSVQHQWYQDGQAISGETGYSIGVVNNSWPANTVHSYYCIVTNTVGTNSWTAMTNTVTFTRNSSVSVTNDGGGGTATIPEQTAQKFSINSSKVDNCSNMYSFLYSNKSRGNVMRSSDIDKAALLRYTNTSEPTINLISYPTVYARSTTAPYPVTSQLAPNPDGDTNLANDTYTLKYDFTITNPTDTTPDATEYYCNLYIDTDSDSRFIEQERIGNIEIHEATAGVVGTLVDSGALKAGQEYIVTRTLSAGMDGFLPWKLEVIKVSDESVHTSVTNYTYVKPTAEIINILQINTGSGGIGLNLDTTRPAISDADINATRNRILDLISPTSRIYDDYHIKIQTITTTQAHNIASSPITNTLDMDTSGNLHAPYTDVKQLIYSYDMVIIGFDDCYAELDEATSTAIVDYLKDNHPILYSHDTTSMSNVPLVYDTASSSSTNYQSTGTYWGYYFNSVLRDPLGLDRYGITNSVFGLTSKSGSLPNATTSGLVAAGYSGLGSAVTSRATPITPAGTTITKQVLLDEGYSIAYLPGSNTAGTGGTPIGTTQGFTNYMYSGNMTSTAVTQVNKGMITTYPFDLNLTSGSTMTILDTHQQYYQANMNPDDVLVWYCLSGTGYDYNDAASAYYIFSNGNATYSGFGHDLKNIGLPEAKLFVNSIIAAYRITNFPPVINFTDATGKNKLNAFLVPADSEGPLLPVTEDASEADTSRYLYFTVNDSNVAKDKTVKAVVSYINPTDPDDPTIGTEVTPEPHIAIYNSQTNEIVTNSNLVSGLAYYIKIDDILYKLIASGVTLGENGIQVQVTVTTHVRGIDLPAVTKSIMLRKFMLFDLG